MKEQLNSALSLLRVEHNRSAHAAAALTPSVCRAMARAGRQFQLDLDDPVAFARTNLSEPGGISLEEGRQLLAAVGKNFGICHDVVGMAIYMPAAGFEREYHANGTLRSAYSDLVRWFVGDLRGADVILRSTSMFEMGSKGCQMRAALPAGTEISLEIRMNEGHHVPKLVVLNEVELKGYLDLSRTYQAVAEVCEHYGIHYHEDKAHMRSCYNTSARAALDVLLDMEPSQKVENFQHPELPLVFSSMTSTQLAD